MSSKTWFDLSALFMVLMAIYNINLRPVSSGDSVPARLLPFSLLQEGNLDLDEFPLIPREASELPGKGRIYASTGDGGGWQEVPGTYRRFSYLTAVQDTKEQLFLFARSQDGTLWESVWAERQRVKWQEIPGGVRTPSRPAAVRDRQGQIRLLVRSQKNTIWENVKKEGQWSGWQQLSRRMLSEPAVARDREGKVRLFIRGVDNALYENRLEEGKWGEWHQIPGGGEVTSGPSVVVDPQGTLWLFARGTDTYVWQRREGREGWSEWQRVPESSTTSRPEAALDGERRVRVFIRRLDTHIYQSVWDTEGWSRWEELPGSGSAADTPSVLHDARGHMLIFVPSLPTEVPKIYWGTLGGSWEVVPGGELSVSGPTVIQDQEGKLRLFVLGPDSSIWENVRDADGWRGWKRLPGRATSRPAVVMDREGRLWLFVRGQDSAVHYTVQGVQGWSEWRGVGGLTPSAPAATVDAVGRIWLFVRRQNNAVYHNVRNPHGWEGWKAMEGLTSSTPAATVDPKGQLWLFIRGLDNVVYYRVRDTHGWGEAWEPVPHGSTLSAPAVTADAAGKLWVFVRGLDGDIWQNVYTDESWTGWRSQGEWEEGYRRSVLAAPDATTDGQGNPLVFARFRYRYVPHFLKEVRGHWMSIFPVVVPMVISPLYLLPVWLMDAYGITSTMPEFSLIVSLMEKLSASLIATLSALFLYLIVRNLCSRRQAIGLTLIYALGTNTWTIGSQALWQHGMSELALSLMVFALLRAAGNERFLVWAGLGAAMATANRSPNVLFALLAVAYVWQYHRKRILLFLLFPALIAPLFLTYNLYYFGTLLGGYGRGVWGTSRYEGLLGLLVSPSRGLLIYTPITLFSLVGMCLVWRQRVPPLFRYLSIGVPVYVLFIAGYSPWWGGFCFGPRYLTDLLPFLSLFLLPTLGKIVGRRPFQIAFGVAVALSVAVQIVGAFFYDGQWDAFPVSVDSDPGRLWDWQDTQIFRSLQTGPTSTLYPQITEVLKKAT